MVSTANKNPQRYVFQQINIIRMPSNNCRLSSLSCHSRTIFIFATQSTHTNIWIAHSFPLRILIWTNLPFNRQKFDRLQHHIVANVNAVYDISIDWFIYYFFFVIWRHSCRKVIEFIQLRSIHVLIHKTLCSVKMAMCWAKKSYFQCHRWRALTSWFVRYCGVFNRNVRSWSSVRVCVSVCLQKFPVH